MKLRLLQMAIVLLLTGMDVVAQSSADHGLKGEYYTGTNFEKKVFIRKDPIIDFDWTGKPPAPGLKDQYYSIRWTGKLLAPASGMYHFTVEVDDGVRVWIGGRKIIDAWDLHDDITFVANVALQAGQLYDLRVDYFNAMLGGEIKLYWVTPDEVKRGTSSLSNLPGSILSPQFLMLPTTRLIAKPVTPKPIAPVVAKPASPTVTARKSPPLVTRRPASKPALSPAKSTSPVVVAARPVVIPVRPVAETVSTEPTVKPTVLENLKPGETVILTQVRFNQSEYTLLPASYAELDRLVQTMQKQSALRVEISGHTDNVGDKQLNQQLSAYRAKVVANYLIQHGIADGRVSDKGYGGSQPVHDNTTETGRMANRRVEVKVW